MADQAITDNGGSTINGRLLARVAAVTLNNTTIFRPTCATEVNPENRGGGDEQEKKNTKGKLWSLPDTGGGVPIRSEDFPYGLVIVGGLSITALILGVRAYRRTHLKQ